MSKIQIWKQSTTPCGVINCGFQMSLICQRYKFESNPQHLNEFYKICSECRLYVKDTNLKAIHNLIRTIELNQDNVAYMSKIQIWKQSTTHWWAALRFEWMSLICQRYKFESNPQPLETVELTFE